MKESPHKLPSHHSVRNSSAFGSPGRFGQSCASCASKNLWDFGSPDGIACFCIELILNKPGGTYSATSKTSGFVLKARNIQLAAECTLAHLGRCGCRTLECGDVGSRLLLTFCASGNNLGHRLSLCSVQRNCAQTSSGEHSSGAYP